MCIRNLLFLPVSRELLRKTKTNLATFVLFDWGFGYSYAFSSGPPGIRYQTGT